MLFLYAIVPNCLLMYTNLEFDIDLKRACLNINYVHLRFN